MVHSTFTALFSAGSNAQGQLAQGTKDDSHCFRRCVFSENPSDQQAYPGNVLSVAAGANHTIVLTQPSVNGTQLWGCGDGRRGQLGHRYQADFGTSSVLRRIDFPEFAEYKISSIAASWQTSFVALSHASYGDILLSAGSNDFGNLGVGSFPGGTESGFSRVSFEKSLPSKYQGLIRIVELRAGPHNTVCVLSCEEEERPGSPIKAVTVGWGASRHGQLEITRHPSQNSQTHISMPITIPIPDVCTCAVGTQHIVFLLSSGSLVGLGSDRKHQISGLDKTCDALLVGATWNGTYIVCRNPHSSGRWSILGTGSNSHGQLASSPGPQTSTPGLHTIRLPTEALEGDFRLLACGSEHILFCTHKATNEQGVYSKTEVWGWGWNEHGNLGLGHTDDVSTPVRIWPHDEMSIESHTRVCGVWAGCGTSWIAVEIDNE